MKDTTFVVPNHAEVRQVKKIKTKKWQVLLAKFNLITGDKPVSAEPEYNGCTPFPLRKSITTCFYVGKGDGTPTS